MFPPTNIPQFVPMGPPIQPMQMQPQSASGFSIGAFFTRKRLKIMLFVVVAAAAVVGWWYWKTRIVRFRLLATDKQKKAIRFVWQGKYYKEDVPVSGSTKISTAAGTVTVLATKFLDAQDPTAEDMIEARIVVEDANGNLLPKYTQTVVLI